MGLRTYKATGAGLRALERGLKLSLRAEGVENLVDRPTLFVVNHFTRFETLVVPYVLYRHTRRQVRTLAAAKLFRGRLGRYLDACGVMSTRHPARNRTIVSELMTRRFDWVIYPEGGLVKNKRVVRGRELWLDTPRRQGPPHTGAAVMALQAELYKRKYLEACARGDEETIGALEERFGLTGPEAIATSGLVIVPVTITYHRMRSHDRRLNRLLAMVRRGRSDAEGAFEEELQVEGSLLLNRMDMCVRFGAPIEVGSFLSGSTEMIRGLMERVSERRAEGVFIRGKARKLTRRFMRSIYGNVEINLDHLVCWGLRALANGKRERVPVERFHRAMYLAACELRDRASEGQDIHVHASLRGDLTGIVSGDHASVPALLAPSIALVEAEGVASRQGADYVIDRAAIARGHDGEAGISFERVRIERMSSVIANEIEPLRKATRVIERMLDLGESKSSGRVRRRIMERDLEEYALARANWVGGESRTGPRDAPHGAAIPGFEDDRGGPFLLDGARSRVGVVLVHGYLASSEEIRPLASMLYAAGVNVYGVRLDGHATAPANLSSVRWEGWIDSILRGVGVMRYHCDRLVIGGFSLGGLLSLHVASTGRADLAGVFSINAPMRLHDRRAMLAPMVVRLDGWRRAAGLGRTPLRRSNAHSESPDINYAEDYIAGLAQAVEVMRVCRKRLADITAPALIVQATGDPVVVRESGQIIHDRIGSQEKTLVELDFDRHIVVRGDGVESVGRHVLDFVASEPVGGPGVVLRDRAERGGRREKDTPKGRKRVRLGFARWR